MSQHPAAPRLLQRLAEVRDGLSQRSEDERRHALEAALSAELGQIDASQREALVNAARAAVVEQARQVQAQLQSLNQQLIAAGEARRAAEAQVVQLREELRQARAATTTAPIGVQAAASVSTPGAPSETTRLADAVREVMRKTVEGQPPDPARLGLSSSGTRLLALVQELLRFTLDCSLTVDVLSERLQSPEASVLLKSFSAQVKKHLAASLDDQEGSIASLRDRLERLRELPNAIFYGFEASVPRGARSLLEELNPDHYPDLNRKSAIGKALDQLLHSDDRDLVEQFFSGAVSEELLKRLPR